MIHTHATIMVEGQLVQRQSGNRQTIDKTNRITFPPNVVDSNVSPSSIQVKGEMHLQQRGQDANLHF